MKKMFLFPALLVGFAYSASAQGIEPVAPIAPDLDVTVGTQQSVDPLLIAIGGAALAIAVIAAGSSSDGTN